MAYLYYDVASVRMIMTTRIFGGNMLVVSQRLPASSKDIIDASVTGKEISMCNTADNPS